MKLIAINTNSHLFLHHYQTNFSLAVVRFLIRFIVFPAQHLCASPTTSLTTSANANSVHLRLAISSRRQIASMPHGSCLFKWPKKSQSIMFLDKKKNVRAHYLRVWDFYRPHARLRIFLVPILRYFSSNMLARASHTATWVGKRVRPYTNTFFTSWRKTRRIEKYTVEHKANGKVELPCYNIEWFSNLKTCSAEISRTLLSDK